MFLNWRKTVILALLEAQRNPILKELKFVRSIERSLPEKIREIQDQRLSGLLRHAWEKTEYYRAMLEECEVVVDGKVNLEEFENIPFLTKEIIGREAKMLKANALPLGRKPYINRTGGSTGEPLEFWQDSYYYAVNVANRLYHFGTMGKGVGEPEMKIWGSERDIFTDTIGWVAKLKNFLYNRNIQNCHRLSEQGICLIIKNINAFKPKIIWSYVDCAYMIAENVNRYGLEVYSPEGIFCGGGTIYPHMEEAIGKAFNCPVINYYGSREMGSIACECMEKAGLHITSHTHRVEVVDINGIPIIDEEGDIVVTSLTNYAMPFIRYRIGDRGKLTTKRCPCGRGFPLLEYVSGRAMESFITPIGEIVSPIYLITMLGTSSNLGFVKRFQIVQNDFSHITLKLIPVAGVGSEEVQAKLQEVYRKIRLVMGGDCRVDYVFVDEIPPTKSGKVLVTICQIPDRNSRVLGQYKSENQ